MYPARLSFMFSRRQAHGKAAKLAVEMLGNGSISDAYVVNESKSQNDLAKKVLYSRGEKSKKADVEAIKREIETLSSQDKQVSLGYLYLRRLLSSISTLFHPSNLGMHTFSVFGFLNNLCGSFVKRLGRQYASKYDSISLVEKRELLSLLLPLAKMGLTGKNENVVLLAGACFAQLAWIAPTTVYEHITPLLSAAFDPSNLTQVHLVPACLQALDVLFQPFLQSRMLLPKILPKLLPLTLPGVDPNDFTKTLQTLKFYETFLRWIPIVDTSKFDYSEMPKANDCAWEHHLTSSCKKYGIDSDSEARNNSESDDERILLGEAMWNAGPTISKWGLDLVGKLLSFFEHQEPLSEDGGMFQKRDEFKLFQVKQVLSLLFQQMDPETRDSAQKIIVNWANTKCLTNAEEYCVSMIRSCYVASTVSGKKNMIQNLFVPMMERIKKPDNYSDRQVSWAFIVTGAIIRVAGSQVVQQEEMLDSAISSILNDVDDIREEKASKLLEQSIRGLVGSYPVNGGSSYECTSDSNIDSVDWRKLAVSWGQSLETVSLKLHKPSHEELKAATRLRDKFLSLALSKVESYMETKDTGVKEWRASLVLITSVIRGSGEYLDTLVSGDSVMVPGVHEEKIRDDLIKKSTNILEWLLANTNNPSLHAVAANCVILSMLLREPCTLSDGTPNQFQGLYEHFSKAMQPYALRAELLATNRRVENEHADALYEPSYVLKSRSSMLEDMREVITELHRQQSVEKCFVAESKPVYVRAFTVLTSSCLHDWTETRKKIQKNYKKLGMRFPKLLCEQLHVLMNHFDYSGVEQISEEQDTKKYAELTGSYYLMNNRKVFRWIVSDWRLFRSFVEKVVVGFDASALSSEQQTASDSRVQELIIGVMNRWNNLPLSDSNITRQDIIDKLEAHGRLSSMSWRKQLSVSGSLSTLIRPDKPNSENMWNWFVDIITTTQNVPLQTNALFALSKLMLIGKNDNYLEESNSARRVDFTDGTFLQKIVSVVSQSHIMAAEDPDESSSSSAPKIGGLMGNLLKMFTGSQKHNKSKWSIGVEELMSYPEISSETAWLHHDGQYGSGFKFSHAFVFFVFTRTLGVKFVEGIVPLLEDLIQGETEQQTAEYKANLVTCSEIVAGMLRAAEKYEYLNDVQEAIVERVLPLVTSSIAETGLNSGSCWVDASVFSCSDGVPQNAWLEMTFESIEGQIMMAPSTRIINSLKVARTLIEELQEENDIVSSLERLSACLFSLHRYEYKAVREQVGVTAAVALHKATRSNHKVKVLHKFVEKLCTLEKKVDTSTGDTYESAFYLGLVLSKLGGYEDYISHLIPVFLEAVNTADSEQSKKFKAICLNVVQSMEAGGIQIIEQLISTGLSAPSWNVRLVAIMMIDAVLANQSSGVGFLGLLYVRKSFERMLYDSEIKIQQQVSLSLRNIVSSFHPESESLKIYVDKYADLLGTLKSEKRKQKHQVPAVFGLSAAVKAFPYSVPSPLSVASLARVKLKEAKSTIEQFKRTHHDTWAFDSQAFTQDQLDDLMGSSEVYGYA
eukprot:CAMPEP_0204839762 /NCGR_PEP_ID=MMETSP1346-20131115/35447_1 /ASSEMBLY_ACC=CAM_ASM_000771 /TAXON_ID=215587 /ORGANISM="Aplanochytrium stocchinoi, Strain GSBS06" /LENGTH=1532 /DNA_ID=CAMNT_0051976749 /DNA_START=323 /DNA_END=4921 /DNA_ORIENTATION=-